MKQAERIAFLERQVEHLSAELNHAMSALDMASSLGNVAKDLSISDSSLGMLQEISNQACSLIPFEAAGVYLVSEDDADFALEHVAPPGLGQVIETEVDRLIADHSFSWALQQAKASIFATQTEEVRLLLHPLATPSRTRGMLVGILGQNVRDISDITLSMLSILAVSSAYALEAQSLYSAFRSFNKNLEIKIQERTRQLSERKALMQSILDTIHTGVVLIEYSSQKVVDINPAALKILGYTRDEVVGRECYSSICPKTKGCCPIIDLGNEIDISERTALHRDGREVPILKSVAAFTLDDNRYLAESFLDITEMKENERLREDVDRIIRHDLKTPLNSICGFPQLLLMSDNLDDDQRQYIRHIEESGFKMLEMINLSLDLYKMEHGTYTFEPNRLDLLKIMNKVLDDLQGIVKERRLIPCMLVNGCPSVGTEVFPVMGEELLCYSMLGNLAKNAIEASPEGKAVIISFRSGTEHTLSITNEGEVPSEFRAHFFGKYSTHGKKGGTGLGTYSAKLMLETMGGEIALDSSTPGMTTVILRFPLL